MRTQSSYSKLYFLSHFTLDNIKRINLNSKNKEAKLGEVKHHVFIYQLFNKWKGLYRAFCGGSIITEDRVLTSTHCFLTNRKRYKRDLKKVKVVAGILHTEAKEPINDSNQQWRTIEHIYSQRYFRFPAHNLAILKLRQPMIFGQFVNKIAYASTDQDFDGVCKTILIKATTSWSKKKFLHIQYVHMVKRRVCESKLLRHLRLYYCSDYDESKSVYSTETEGAGLVCYDTHDPAEVDNQGLLVGVTSVIHNDLPTLYMKIGLFSQWVTDGSIKIATDKILTMFLLWSVVIFFY